MTDQKKVEKIVNEWLEGKEYFLTDLSISEDDCIVVEIDHKDGVWIDDCVDLSKYIEAHLDRNTEDYELEVGSAGIGQPFKVKRQYVNHIGEAVELKTKGGEKLTGTLKAVGDDGVTLTLRVKVKPEGAKRPKLTDVDRDIPMSDIESCSAKINFK